MKAIETIVKTDTEGNLHLNYSSNMKNTDVKVILMFPEKDEGDENLWIKAIASNPARAGRRWCCRGHHGQTSRAT